MACFLPKHFEDRFTERAKNSLYSACATKNARPIHLLYALASQNGSLAKSILETHKITTEQVARMLPKENSARNAVPFPCDELKGIIKKSAQIAASQRQPYIGTEHILYALVYKAPHLQDIQNLLTAQKIIQIKRHLDTIFSQNIRFSSFYNIFKNRSRRTIPIVNSTIHKFPKIKVKKQDEKEEHDRHIRVKKSTDTPALDAFSENLTSLAQAQTLDPVIGREKEISRIINILSRRTKNNPLLVGEPGVGKTAVVQGLAQRINNGEVPSSLLHKKIFSLNLNSLIAGTMFRGDFEARMQDIVEEASDKDIILFIDEIHTVIGAGSASGTLDAANILKPALSQGKIRCIGATTTDEYRRYIEKDRALERRLQIVTIEEETEEQSIATLSQLKKLYEKYHEIEIDDEAVEAAVRLSSRYIHNRFLPDKALDVLDEAASRLKSKAAITENTRRMIELEQRKLHLGKNKEKAIAEENYEDAIVLKYKEELAEEEIKTFKKKFPLFDGRLLLKKSDIEETVEEMTGIPVRGHSNTDDVAELKKLEALLNKEIIGQKQAIAEVISAIKRKRAGISGTTRHAGSFLFLGPCGVGKTALAKALSEKNSQTLIALNMSEYAEPHTISRLIGSPPGYVGYGEGGELTEKIKRHPYAVILFDEIEKAHPQVHNLLLSILEDSILQDSLGRVVSFKNATLILTSNIGFSDEEQYRALGFTNKKSRAREAVNYIEKIKYALRPEIINRIDKIVVFNSLDKKEIFAISKLFIEKLKKRLSHLNIAISNEAVELTAQKSYKHGEGARYVRATIEQLIEGPLAEHLILNRDARNVKIDLVNGKVCVS